MIIKRLMSFVLLVVGCIANAQIIHIKADRKVEDDAFKKSQAILPVYRYLNDSIEPYTKFGVEPDTTKPWYKIKKFPDMEACRDTGYTYIYFAGADNAHRQGYILTLIGNYRRSRRSVFLYIDRNNDLDFSNDGAPDTILFTEYSKEIVLENKDVKGANYTMKLTRFKYGENVRYKNLVAKHYRNRSSKKLFTEINYCFRVQRYNSILANYRSDTDSFTIGIKDLNVNGIYNESCTDKLYVGPYKSQINSVDLFDMVPTVTNNVFEWNGKKYRIKAIETTGTYVDIEEDPNAKLSNKLEVGKKVPNFEYFNILSVKHELNEYKKQEVFLFFWDKEEISSEDTAYLNKINSEFKDRIKIITLNHGDEPKDVRIIFYYDKIKWPMGYSNTEIGNKYFLEDVTRGFYIGKRRNLLDEFISPKEMYTILSTEE